jgi:hypothetical protein
MEINDAILILERCKMGAGGREQNLTVEIFSPSSIGGTPCTKVTAINPGIDWDAGKIIINTEQPLTALTPEQVEAITKSVKEGNSWHAYEREKKNKAKLDELLSRMKVADPELGEIDAQAAYHSLSVRHKALAAERDELLSSMRHVAGGAIDPNVPRYAIAKAAEAAIAKCGAQPQGLRRDIEEFCCIWIEQSQKWVLLLPDGTVIDRNFGAIGYAVGAALDVTGRGEIEFDCVVDTGEFYRYMRCDEYWIGDATAKAGA